MRESAPTAARAAKGLVGGGGNKVRDADRVRVYACRDQAGIVCHVHEEIGAHAVGNGAEALPVHHQRIGRRACHDHLRLVRRRQRLHLVALRKNPKLPSDFWEKAGPYLAERTANVQHVMVNNLDIMDKIEEAVNTVSGSPGPCLTP